ncbi:pirin-like isoform X1 [Lytechinus variegatus]|uniref:pirin-like isoform X1 n=1 Tax=Lytechinus variegatus TaxID=7654 RepID=UPI001BB1BF18|nr:pirin-like isoform X1 [Lytechinus variegatus]XP_041454057.1 pirin-like isoform X1 [Lytechinus variegatus]
MGQTGSHAKSLTKTKKAKERRDVDKNDRADSARRVVKVIDSVEQEEGLGAKVKRSIGCEEHEYLDPFLRLDEFDISKPAGFPDHPHRGYETVTYILTGCLDFEDFKDNKGTIDNGDVQWLSAGRGIVHTEMPAGEESCHGLQLWINLTSGDKMVESVYQDIKKEDIPFATEGGASVRVIAGEALGSKSCVTTRTPTIFLDVELEEKASITQVIPQGWNAFIYILSGKVNIGSDENVKEGVKSQILVLSDGPSVEASNKESDMCRFLLIAGKPLNEPVEREGNFVMNTVAEVEDAIKDHRFGRNGFENAPDWNSQSALAYLDSQF